jgi:hypothetical protein
MSKCYADRLLRAGAVLRVFSLWLMAVECVVSGPSFAVGCVFERPLGSLCVVVETAYVRNFDLSNLIRGVERGISTCSRLIEIGVC